MMTVTYLMKKCATGVDCCQIRLDSEHWQSQWHSSIGLAKRIRTIVAVTVVLASLSIVRAADQRETPGGGEGRATTKDAAGVDVDVDVDVEGPISADGDAEAPIAGAREFLSLNGVDDSHFRSFIDGRPVIADENEALWRVLFAVRRLAAYPSNVERWALRDVSLKQLADDPSARRGELFWFSGRVTHVALEKPLPEVVGRFDLKQYYRCDAVISSGGEEWPATVYAVKIPDAWKSGKALDERISFYGIFLKHGRGEDEASRPVFVADRIAWHAETVLGEWGVDVGLFDNLENRRSLSSKERECFYQILDAAGRAGIERLDRWTRNRKFSVTPLFNDPGSQHGRLVALDGIARRAVEVHIENPDIIRRFGFDRYWEVEVFTDDSQSNPITFCLRQLPEAMPTGDGIYERVRIPGFFFKVWAYRVQMHLGPDGRNAQGRVPRRYAPLVIGEEPLWFPNEDKATAPFAGALAGGLFVLALIGIWFALWRSHRRDQRYHKEALAKKNPPEATVSLNDLSIADDGEPDFSSLSKNE